MNIPTREESLRILKNNVPDNIIAHLKAVAEFSEKVMDVLEKRGIKVNRELVRAAALLHDVKKMGPNHETRGAEYIKSLGYPDVANLILRHGLAKLNDENFVPKTWEEKIVFYSDKRLKDDRIVSVDERFDDIRKRYKRDIVEHEYQLTRKIEKELLGDEELK